MNKKKFLEEKYLATVDLLHLKNDITHKRPDLDSMEYINEPDEIAGYYVHYYKDNALEQWQENTSHLDLNKIEKQVEKLLIEVTTPEVTDIDLEVMINEDGVFEILVWTSITYGIQETSYAWCTPITEQDILNSNINTMKLIPYIYDTTHLNISGERYYKEIVVIECAIREHLNTDIYQTLRNKFNSNTKDIVYMSKNQMNFSYHVQKF